MPEMNLPEPFDGRAVVKTTVKIKNAGDGLSKAMAADAQTIHLGERLTVVLEVDCSGVDVRPLDKDDLSGPVTVAYVLSATSKATIVDDKLVRAALDAQQKRNDEAAGKPQMDFPDAEAPAALAPDDDPSVPSPGMQGASNGETAPRPARRATKATKAAKALAEPPSGN